MGGGRWDAGVARQGEKRGQACSKAKPGMQAMAADTMLRAMPRRLGCQGSEARQYCRQAVKTGEATQYETTGKAKEAGSQARPSRKEKAVRQAGKGRETKPC